VRDLLWAEAVLGKDAEEFLNTELGRYMLGRCEQEIQEAQDELSRVSSWRRRRIQELQNRVWRAKSVKEWLAELISNGKSAEAALEETE
jgi:hypothetical protein